MGTSRVAWLLRDRLHNFSVGRHNMLREDNSDVLETAPELHVFLTRAYLFAWWRLKVIISVWPKWEYT